MENCGKLQLPVHCYVIVISTISCTSLIEGWLKFHDLRDKDKKKETGNKWERVKINAHIL